MPGADRHARTRLPHPPPYARPPGGLSSFVFNFLSTPFRRAVQPLPPVVVVEQVEERVDDDHDDPPPVPPTPSAHSRLARFFAEKGDSPLTDVETEGVLRLMQTGRGDEEQPATSFPPSRPSDRPLFVTRSRTQPSLSQRSQSIVVNGFATSSSDPSLPVATLVNRPSQTRKAIYLGPGISPSLAAARRRRANKSTTAQLFGSSSELATRWTGTNDASAVPGKKSKVDDRVLTLPTTLTHAAKFPNVPANPAAKPFPPSAQLLDVQTPPSSQKRKQPSPLRSVVGQPTPSPLKRDTVSRTPAKSSASPRKSAVASPAANIMLSVLRANADDRNITAEDVINPYATRSRTRSGQVKGKSTTTAADSPNKKKRAAIKGVAKEKSSSSISFEETIPLEFRPLDESGRPMRMHKSEKDKNQTGSLLGPSPFAKPGSFQFQAKVLHPETGKSHEPASSTGPVARSEVKVPARQNKPTDLVVPMPASIFGAKPPLSSPLATSKPLVGPDYRSSSSSPDTVPPAEVQPTSSSLELSTKTSTSSKPVVTNERNGMSGLKATPVPDFGLSPTIYAQPVQATPSLKKLQKVDALKGWMPAGSDKHAAYKKAAIGVLQRGENVDGGFQDLLQSLVVAPAVEEAEEVVKWKHEVLEREKRGEVLPVFTLA